MIRYSGELVLAALLLDDCLGFFPIQNITSFLYTRVDELSLLHWFFEPLLIKYGLINAFIVRLVALLVSVESKRRASSH